MKKTLIIIFTLSVAVMSYSQEAKRALTVNDIAEWRRITQKEISPRGLYVAARVETWKGASDVNLYDAKARLIFTRDSSSNITFDQTGEFLLFKRGEGKRQSLHIFSINNKRERVVGEVKDYLIPKECGQYFLYRSQDSTLVMESFDGKVFKSAGRAEGYKVSENGQKVISHYKGIVIVHDMEKELSDTIMHSAKAPVKLAASKNGNRFSFLSAGDLYVTDRERETKKIAEKVSDKRELVFSPDESKLYYGSLPEPLVRDTSYAKDQFPQVHIWHWNEGRQFTAQVVDKKGDEQRSFLSVYTFQSAENFLIANDNITSTHLVKEGDSQFVLALSDIRYRLEHMWEGRIKNDIYIVNTALQRVSLAIEGVNGQVRVSPAGKYAYWYSAVDSAWFSLNIQTGQSLKITEPSVIKCFDEDNDVPDWPSSYSAAGWSRDDAFFLVYDKYDIWKVAPDRSVPAVNLTVNGREKGITYRYSVTKEEEYIDIESDMFLTAFNNITKGYSYHILNLRQGKEPAMLYGGDMMLTTPVRAKESPVYMFTRESFTEFPDIWVADLKFKKPVKMTDINPQQKSFNWGTAQLVSWVSLDGVSLEGVLYKPENFDPAQKYPMIVNFYEKNSSSLYAHRVPEPHRSTVDYHMYTSNGYLIFNPDIVYKDGYPGESAFNSVMPGITTIVNMGFVDSKRIGAQGHSWGGYQVAYMATRTNLFAAIESGAPVVNMFSAYGGIRWGTGLNRSFQYEHQQSRIGKTPWESPLRYIENSPLFTMDKVTTPILIMHNDQDGHVPWYQGIEYFVALKRLRKPVWLLNYTGEVHWPQKMKNKIDFQIRMKQFFDHYLKDMPAPGWMKEPMSAIELDFNLGY